MQEVKFQTQFQKVTGGRFPMLKLRSATYVRATRRLTVRFMIDAASVKSFSREDEEAVAAAVAEMFGSIDTSVEYIRTHADRDTVMARIVAFFNEFNRFALRGLDADASKVEITKDDIKVTLFLDTPLADLLKSSSADRQLADWLDLSFNQRSAVQIVGTGMPELQKERPVASTSFAGFATRLVSISEAVKIYAKGSMEAVSQMPMYIADLKPAENAVICGKVSGLAVRKYKNKRYDPQKPSVQPPELKLVRFNLDDTTGMVECVCFPSPSKEKELEKLHDGMTVVCVGQAAVSAHTGALGLTCAAVFSCKIDYDSLKKINRRSAPAKYTVVSPEPYTEPEELPDNLLDYAAPEDAQKSEEDRAVPAAMLGKTFVVMDFEATDKDMTAEPIELAALKIKDGVAVETFGSLLDPGKHIAPEITKLTGISDRMVEGKPSFVEILPDFFKFAEGAVLVGHNIDGYDFPLLRKYSDKAGFLFDNERMDTLTLAKKYIPNSEVPRYSLEELAKHFGISHRNAHRAMADVMATAELLRIILKRAEK